MSTHSLKLRASLVCLIIALMTWASRHFIVDDGLIYARFIRNALNGQGLVFNSGDHINALTSPCFTYLLLGFSWLLRGHVLLAEHLLFSLSLGAACIVAETIAPWAGVALASTAYFYSTIGLETSLFLFLLALTAKLYTDRRYDALPLLLLLTALTRFEGGILIPILAWLLWRERRIPRLRAFVVPALIILLYLFLNHHWYGSILPNSASSKFGQARSGYWGEWPTAFFRVTGWALYGKMPLFRHTFFIPILVAWFAVNGWRRMHQARWSQILAPVWLGLLLFYILFNIPSYTWYYAPLIFIPFLYAAAGLPRTSWPRATVFGLFLLAGVINFILVARHFTPDLDYTNMALWIDANTPTSASVETVEIGQIGWTANRRIIDILGLTYPKNADHIAHRDPSSWLAEDRPDYVIVHKPLWLYESVTATHPEYQELPFHSGNVYLLKRMTP